MFAMPRGAGCVPRETLAAAKKQSPTHASKGVAGEFSCATRVAPWDGKMCERTTKKLLDAVEALASIRLVLSDDPLVSVGNSRVHFAYHKAKGALENLN